MMYRKLLTDKTVTLCTDRKVGCMSDIQDAIDRRDGDIVYKQDGNLGRMVRMHVTNACDV